MIEGASMSQPITRFTLMSFAGVACAAVFASTVGGASPTCDPNNGGLTLPSGFCAMVVADGLGTARHLAVAPNGDVYVALQRGPGGGRGEQAPPGGVVALRDADGDGRFETKKMIPGESTTG